MPKIDMTMVTHRQGSGYPAPFHETAAGRIKSALGDAGGLTQFGVNLVTLPSGGWSSQRHWHNDEDEFVLVLAGELTLITDAGEEKVGVGECAAFPKGVADGHHFINRGQQPAVYLEVGTRAEADTCCYPDIDLQLTDEAGFTHKDGTPYPPRSRG